MIGPQVLAAAVAGRSLRDAVELERDVMQPLLSVDGDWGASGSDLLMHALVVVSIEDTTELPAIATIAARLESCRALTFVADAYLEFGPAQAQRGDLTRRWEAGDRTGITEALLVTTAYRDGRLEMLAWPYEATPDGLVWAPQPRSVPQITGLVPEALRAAFLTARRAPDPLLTTAGLIAALAHHGYAATTWNEPSLN